MAAGAAAAMLFVAACEPEDAATATGAEARPAPSAAAKAKPSTKRSPAAPAPKLPPGDNGVVTRHTDGDTLRVDDVKVRLIGVDTPEVHSGVECYGKAASARTAALLPIGTRVRLVYDVDRRDRYGRTLAYVYRIRDGLFVNAELVRTGFASTMTVPPNVAHAAEFVRLQRSARAAKRGLWSVCGGNAPPPQAKPRTQPKPQPKSQPKKRSAGCHPSYPDVCIPPAPPDLDCPDIPHEDFAVVGDDPHRFDGDHDGLGCES